MKSTIKNIIIGLLTIFVIALALQLREAKYELRLSKQMNSQLSGSNNNLQQRLVGMTPIFTNGVLTNK